MKKTVGIVLAVFVLLSCTTIFAQSNVGGKTFSWYSKSFKTFAEYQLSEISSELTRIESGVKDEILFSIQEMNKVLEERVDGSFLEKEKVIGHYKGQYVKELEIVKQDLMEVNFTQYTEEETEKVNIEIEEDIEEFLEEILSK